MLEACADETSLRGKVREIWITRKANTYNVTIDEPNVTIEEPKYEAVASSHTSSDDKHNSIRIEYGYCNGI